MLALTAALFAFTPVVLHDSAERFPLPRAAYGHAVPAREGGVWLQYWLYYRYQDQDRGIVRAGRHAGDWEVVQFRVVGDRLAEAVYAQHSGAERCGAGAVTFRGGRPVVFAAHGSHASYLRAGTRDRMWPDPNDEADGRGAVVVPSLVEISRTSPPWMADPRPWGPSLARWFIPPEQSSPRGPAFQPERWDANALAAAAGPCRASCDRVGECDGAEKGLTAAAIAAPLAFAAALWRRRRRR